MPRVAIKKREYLKKDLTACIVGKMYQDNYTQATLGKELGITQQAMGKKIKEAKFTLDDLLTIFKVLNFSDEEIIKFLKIY